MYGFEMGIAKELFGVKKLICELREYINFLPVSS